VSRCGDDMEVASEENKSSSWGTPWSINTANMVSPSIGNSHGLFSSHQPSLQSNHHPWKSRDNSWKNASHFGRDM